MEIQIKEVSNHYLVLKKAFNLIVFEMRIRFWFVFITFVITLFFESTTHIQLLSSQRQYNSLVVSVVVNRKPSAPERDVEKSSVRIDGKNQPVRFRIADDDEEAADETTSLTVKPPPYILIESPSSTKIIDDGTSPTPV